ncbi:hypothetical protein ISS40_07885 [Candidatus Bathyarchaeota archaeon]|nr:hypothetical protein [Candidatus Bathyarchaeota archaeon]
MAVGLKPVQAVECALHKRLIAVEGCRLCEFCEEVRSPWRHYAVKCGFPGATSSAVYP